MRKAIMILGTILITAVIIISGSAVATWIYAQSIVSYSNVTNRNYILGAPNGNYASLGQDPPPVLGWILLDLGSGNEMPNNQDFTVFALSTTQENYSVFVGITSDIEALIYVGSGIDTQNETFQTPYDDADAWRYILIEGISGIGALVGGDYAYGPDIDAVGWDKP